MTFSLDEQIKIGKVVPNLYQSPGNFVNKVKNKD